MARQRTRTLTLAVAAGCIAAVTGAGTPVVAQDPVTLRVMGFQVVANEVGTPLDTAYKQFLADFQTNNPGIVIESLETPPEADAQTLVDLAAGAGPDIWQQDASSLAKYVDAGVVLDMRECQTVLPTLDLERFFPSVLAINQREDGAIWGLPNDFTPMVLYLSNAAFANAGVDKPQAPWTWDDLLSVAQQTTLDTSGRNVLDAAFDAANVAQWGYRVRQYPFEWIYRLWENGGDVLSPDGTTATGYLDSPESIAAIQAHADLMLVHKVAPPLNVLSSMTAELGFGDRFLKGEFAIFNSGHWELVGLQNSPEWSTEAIDIVAQPAGAASPATVIYQSTFAISSRLADDPAKLLAACTFVDAATSPAYQDTKVITGVAISGNATSAGEAIGASVLPDVETKFQAAVADGRAPWGAKLAAYPAIETVLTSMMERILNGAPVADEVAAAVQEINRELGG